MQIISCLKTFLSAAFFYFSTFFLVPFFITPAWADEGQTTYTDITYVLEGTFSIQGTTFGIGDQTFSNLAYKQSNSSWGTNGGTGDQSPFDNPATDGQTPFSQAFIRIRYANQGNQCGSPIQTTGSIVEWYFPIEFQQTNGATVNVNVDHSAGLIDSTLTNCGGGDSPCQNHVPTINYNLDALNQGSFSGTTLVWGSCSPDPSGNNSWSFANARKTAGSGCVRYNAFGNTNSESDMVPSSGKGDSYQTWNQQFKPFVFNSSDLTTATFTMEPMQIPNGTGESNTWLEITNSNVLSSTCVNITL